MLNQRQIGAYISKLRKEKNMTQGMLADELNVSHQAVSKWERGDSLPDIGTLDALARYFNKTVDQLLSPSSYVDSTHMNAFVRHMNQNEPDQAAAIVNEDHTDTMTDLAPLIMTNALEEVAEKVEPGHFSIEQLAELAPFVGGHILDQLVDGHKEGAQLSAVMDLSPFLSRTVLVRLMNELKGEAINVQQICELAPFLGHEADDFLVKTDISEITWDEINALAPFIGGKALQSLIETQSDALSLERIADIAPFLQTVIDPLIEGADKSNMSWETIERLAPFISRPALGTLVKLLPQQPNISMLTELAPFLSREDLETCLLEAGGQLTPEAIVALAPFVRKETMTNLLTAMNN